MQLKYLQVVLPWENRLKTQIYITNEDLLLRASFSNYSHYMFQYFPLNPQKNLQTSLTVLWKLKLLL